MANFPKLFEPGKIGNMELRNRVVSPPHVTRLVAKNGGVSDALVAYYSARARAGAALVVVEGTYVDKHYPTRFYAGSDAFIPGLKLLSDAIHKFGAKAAVQINVSRGRADEFESVGPSAVPHPISGARPRVLSVEEIEWLVEANAEGARRVRDAGFDAIMIHASHGYMVSDFLSPLSNKREDKYGGSLGNRARLLIDLVHRTKKKAGADFPVLVRLMGSDRVGHFSFDDAAVVAMMLQDAHVPYIDVTTGAAEAYEWSVPSERLPRACNVDAARVVKKAVSIPISVTGRINDPYLAEEILKEGIADFVGLARPLLADPEFLLKAQEGRPQEIRKCIACTRCIEFSIEKPDPIRCTVNPFGGRESEIELKPAEKARRVLVVGGGPAGMEAARVTALRGHKVALWEKAERLGGQLHLACLPPDKAGLQSLTEYLTGQMQKLGVQVELGKEATPQSVLAFKADAVIVAVGATPKRPDIPGADLDKVVIASDVLAGKAQAGQRCVVLAIDSIGCEVADFLADRYRDVTVVDPSKTVASDMRGYVVYMARIPLVNNLRRKMVRMLANTKPVAITEEGVTVINSEGKQQVIPADTVVAAVGFNPHKELFQALENKAKVYQIGDCAEPRRIMEATHEAAEAALQI